MVRPKELRAALRSVCAKSSDDFSKWRLEQFEEQLADPLEEGVGLSMFLAPWKRSLHVTSFEVGRQPGGIQWNDLWLNLIGPLYITL